MATRGLAALPEFPASQAKTELEDDGEDDYACRNELKLRLSNVERRTLNESRRHCLGPSRVRFWLGGPGFSDLFRHGVQLGLRDVVQPFEIPYTAFS